MSTDRRVWRLIESLSSGSFPGGTVFRGIEGEGGFTGEVSIGEVSGTSIAVRETHISWVLLAGPWGLKIKKPVRNEFLDYSTLERRWAACQQEVVLNRRTAGDLYVGVVGIEAGRDEHGPLRLRLVPPSAAPHPPSAMIEAAVLMHRFADDALLGQELADGRLRPEEVDALAASLAEFHRQAARAHPEDPWGEGTIVLEDQAENLASLREWNLRRGGPLSMEPLEQWTARWGGTLVDVFTARKREGQIRECHGDLHLDNIARWQGRLVPFDGIEFSPRLRWIDVQSDIAFLSMDFHARGAPHWGHRMVNAYLESSGDYAGLSVLGWYEVYRALVRAKVAAIRADQEDAAASTSSSTRRAGQEASPGSGALPLTGRYLELATRLADRRPPQILITSGPSGSGKTYHSQRWVDEEGFIRVRADVERQRMFAAGPNRYSDVATLATYEHLARLVALGVAAGYSMIVDATFLKRRQREQFRSLAAKLKVPFGILALGADEATLAQRIVARAAQGDDASEADVGVMQHQLQTAEPLTPEERSSVILPGPDRGFAPEP